MISCCDKKDITNHKISINHSKTTSKRRLHKIKSKGAQMVNNFLFAFIISKSFHIPIPKKALRKNIKLYSSTNGYLNYLGKN